MDNLICWVCWPIVWGCNITSNCAPLRIFVGQKNGQLDAHDFGCTGASAGENQPRTGRNPWFSEMDSKHLLETESLALVLDDQFAIGMRFW